MIRDVMRDSLQGFSLPKYDDIPDVGLYLEQTAKYVSQCLSPLEGVSITTSMISNYVKRGLIDSPKKKQYDRDRIAYIIYIAAVKNVLTIDEIQKTVGIQKNSYPAKVAYDYFASEFENVLQYVFGIKESLDNVGVENTDEKIMLRNTIITAAHKIYLDKLFAVMG
ncbi:MAG: DUF1836 domain-containing protein [Clostridiales bacterium]|nr:DUF1836 domain-containing protein [Clostridiales bacterium]MBQ2818603.1 DUF1836 domain-containing protein [Clostridia bacterium]